MDQLAHACGVTLFTQGFVLILLKCTSCLVCFEAIGVTKRTKGSENVLQQDEAELLNSK